MKYTAQQIRDLTDAGVTVYCGNTGYEVIKDNIGQYMIRCKSNDYCVGLTWQDGVTLNGTDFFTAEDVTTKKYI